MTGEESTYPVSPGAAEGPGRGKERRHYHLGWGGGFVDREEVLTPGGAAGLTVSQRSMWSHFLRLSELDPPQVLRLPIQLPGEEPTSAGHTLGTKLCCKHCAWTPPHQP